MQQQQQEQQQLQQQQQQQQELEHKQPLEELLNRQKGQEQKIPDMLGTLDFPKDFGE
jgi:hypothetical protein